MKKLITLLLALFPLLATAQWKQYNTGQPSLIVNLSVSGENKVWCVDQTHQGLSYSEDAGKNWSFQAFPEEMFNNAIGGFAPAGAQGLYTVIALGENKGIFQSLNNGVSWAHLPNAYNSCNVFPNFVSFFNDNDGVAVGDGSAALSMEIFVTNDGGKLWTLLSPDRLPVGQDWSFNTNSLVRMHGDTLYFMAGSGKIFKTTDKGWHWTSIQTPVNQGNFSYFDFKDENHGLLTYNNTSTGETALYRTSNGGQSWETVSTTGFNSYILYDYKLKAYLSTHHQTGLSYSYDDGTTWIKHPSFDRVGVRAISITPEGKYYISGWSNLYVSTNPLGINPNVVSMTKTGANTILVEYSTEIDPVTSQDTSHYRCGFVENAAFNKIELHSAVRDAGNAKLVVLTSKQALPDDTLRIYVSNVYDINGVENGWPVLSNPTGLVKTLLPVSTNSAYLPASSVWVDASGTLMTTGAIDAKTAEVYDASGKLIMSRTLESGPVKLGTLSKGFYLVRLTGGKTELTTNYIRQ